MLKICGGLGAVTMPSTPGASSKPTTTVPVSRSIVINPNARFGFYPYEWDRWSQRSYEPYYPPKQTPAPCPIGLISLTAEQRALLAKGQVVTLYVVNACQQIVPLTIQG